MRLVYTFVIIHLLFTQWGLADQNPVLKWYYFNSPKEAGKIAKWDPADNFTITKEGASWNGKTSILLQPFAVGSVAAHERFRQGGDVRPERIR